MKIPRGIRNNNPANIRRGSSWKGLVPFLVDSLNNQRYYDKQFCQFSEMKYGVRALLVLLRTYHYKYKLDTIAKVLHRFAPLSENNTYAYISNVCRWMSDFYNEIEYDDDVKNMFPFYYEDTHISCWYFNPQTPTFACRCLAKCICRQETGFELSDELLNDAIKLL